MAANQRQTDGRLEREEIFRRNSLLIIDKMVELSNETPEDTSGLVDEILHSIFFLGNINRPPYSPEKILGNEAILNELRECYPKPFGLYSSQLPKRSPFSCVLDMVVHLHGQERENEIMNTLQNLTRQLFRGQKANYLISFTICVSQRTEIPNSVRYYGVSMSTCGAVPGKIMVAASCLAAWDSLVADAVMTYDPYKARNRSYFDGTIQLPETVRCHTFTLSNINLIPPCRSCGILFGLPTQEKKEWVYGNCAEAESLSNLLKNEQDFKNQFVPTSPMYTPENRQRAERSVLRFLNSLLRDVGFDWDNNFYTPKI